ncbi:MAG: hypothetical protein LBL01_06820 [Bifidobacteriaceae bacterium]|jgi:hypothetical protein|nr:hypothetical protein [Bifidobacteriaceae bacterium]
MSYEEHRRQQVEQANAADWLRMDEDVDFEPEPMGLGFGASDPFGDDSPTRDA